MKNPYVLAILAGAGAIVIVGVVAWRYREKFNPVSRENLAYQGGGAVVQVLSDGAEETVGGIFSRLREWVSGDDAAIRAMKAGAPPRVVKPVALPNPRDAR